MSDVPDTAVCLGCGYSLRGLPSAVCPECGRGFEPQDPASYRDPSGPGSLLRLANAPGLWHRRTIVLLAVILILDRSSPGQLLGFSCFYYLYPFLCLSILAVDYLIRLVAAVAKRIRDRPVSSPTGKASSRKCWLVTPTCALVLASMTLYPCPAWVRFRLSRSALERAVAAGSSSRDWDLVGLFIVRRIAARGNGVVFVSTGLSLFGEEGLAYGPTEQAINASGVLTHEAIAPSWYIGELDW